MSYTNKNTNMSIKPARRRKRWPFVALTIVVIAGIAGGLTYALRNNDPATPARTASSATKGEPAGSASSGSSSNGSNSSSGDKTPTESSDKDNSTPNSNATLVDPTGNFVSNHHPNLSGKPAPNQIQSVCNTTPGASCQISFTKDGVTKTLASQKTDSGGATYWTWKVQDVGLTTGSWQVKATATLGSQTKTADDAMALEVAE